MARIVCVVGYRLADPFRWSGRGGAGLIEVRDAEE